MEATTIRARRRPVRRTRPQATEAIPRAPSSRNASRAPAACSPRSAASASLLLLLAALLTAGCGGADEDLASVEGRITLNGEPLADARVEFDPITEEADFGKSTGSSSMAMTDANGRYTLQYTAEHDGALVGKHTVRITTRRMTVDPDGKENLVPERLPPECHVASTIVKEVEPGSNTINIDLPPKPATGAPADP